MLSTLTLAALAMAAPIPKDTRPPGPAPRLVEFAPGPDGKVRVLIVRTEKKQVTQVVPVAHPNGQVELKQEVREVPFTTTASVELSEVRNLAVYTADGKEADKAAALRKLSDGGVAVVSADGQKVDPKFLKLFKDDTLVLVSPELTALGGPGMPAPTGMAPAIRFNAAPVPGIPVGPKPLPPPPPPIQPLPVPAPAPPQPAPPVKKD